MAFVSARAPSPKVRIFTDEAGVETVREGGSRAWRNFNPGNIQKGSFADAHGAIGGDTRFAIFPSEAVGRNAIVALLRTPSYASLTLEQAINRYAPPSENNTAGYVAFVATKTGIAANTILNQLNANKLGKIAGAIKEIEGWIKGSVYQNAPFAMAVAAIASPISSAAPAADDWMKIANDQASLPALERSEWRDPGENPRILEYFRIAAPWFNAKSLGGDEVNWCAAFVNYCLETAGYAGTGHPGARSFFWNKNKHFIEIDKPRFGCVAVFRDAPFTNAAWPNGTGHVGFVVDWNMDQLELLGGNQSKTVRRQWYDRQVSSGGSVSRKLVALMVPAMN